MCVHKFSENRDEEKRTAHGRPYGIRFSRFARKHLCSVVQLDRGEGVQRTMSSGAGYRGCISPCSVPPLADSPWPSLRYSFLTFRAETCLFRRATTSQERCSEDVVLGCRIQGASSPLLRLIKVFPPGGWNGSPGCKGDARCRCYPSQGYSGTGHR